MTGVRVTTTVAIDPDVLRAIKAWAARTGRQDADIVDEALRRYLATSEATAEDTADRQALRALLRQRAECAEAIDDAAALDLATAELHAARQERRHA